MLLGNCHNDRIGLKCEGEVVHFAYKSTAQVEKVLFSTNIEHIDQMIGINLGSISDCKINV